MTHADPLLSREDARELARLIETALPYHVHLGLKVDELKPGYARLRLPFKPEFVGDVRRPALHGGLISFLVDTCGGCAVWACCRRDDRIATIDMRVDYLRPAPEDDLIAIGAVKLLGNRVGNAQVEVFAAGDPSQILAEGRAVYNIRRAEGPQRGG